MSDQPADGEQATAPRPGPTPETTTSPTTEQATAEQPTTEQAEPEQAEPEQAELPKRAESPFGTPTVSRDEPTAEPAPAASFPSRVTPGLITAAVGALITFFAAFLTWATVDVTSRVGGLPPGGGIPAATGLEGNRLGKATIVLAIAVLLLIALMQLPATRPKAWIVLAVAGGLIMALALLDLVAISSSSDLPDRLAAVPACSQGIQCTAERSAGIGVYLTILGGLVVLIGALLHAGVFTKLEARLRQRRS
jgi:hypothetical protein